jgi:hypothetical protein
VNTLQALELEAPVDTHMEIDKPLLAIIEDSLYKDTIKYVM